MLYGHLAQKVLNAVMVQEGIPDIMKRGKLVPVYKGGGKDPLKTDSYRGIILTSIVVKVLEFLYYWEDCRWYSLLKVIPMRIRQPIRSHCLVAMPYSLHKSSF